MVQPGDGFERMWAHVAALGDQLEASWSAGAGAGEARAIEHVVVCGMGGSAVAAELVSSILDPRRMRIEVHRDYGLGPVDPGALLVFSSYSGATEEVISAWEAAEETAPKNPRVVIGSGGELMERAARAGIAHLAIPPGLPPRASLGHGIGVLCALLERVGDPGLAEQLPATVDALRAGVDRWGLTGSASDDSLLALARRLTGRLPVLYSGCRLTHAVARRWRAQLNENAKLLVGSAELPELDHNEIVGWGQRTATRAQATVVALRDESESPRIGLRFAATREALGLGADAWVERAPRPGPPLARVMTLVQEGDALSCLIAREAGIDPVEVGVIDRVKQRLASS